jgi:hypothetical protein
MTKLKDPDDRVASPILTAASGNGAVVIPATPGKQIEIGSISVACQSISGTGSDAVCLHGTFAGTAETIPGSFLVANNVDPVGPLFPSTALSFPRGLSCDVDTAVTFAVTYGTYGTYRVSISYTLQ